MLLSSAYCFSAKRKTTSWVSTSPPAPPINLRAIHRPMEQEFVFAVADELRNSL
jgi:hypothetical protein